MLQYRAVHQATLELLRELSSLDEIKDFSLVGGTSLALHLGHRISVDLDFFSERPFDETKLLAKLRSLLSPVNILTQSENSLNLFIREIRTGFLSLQYKKCKPIKKVDGISIFAIEDIAAMKLSAIASRGTKKDFYDIYFILQEFSLPEIFSFMNQKYPDLNQLQVLMSLTYFDDAEYSLEPVILKPVDWHAVKEFLAEVVRNFS
ncbi:MAG: nucleotidyl transferase AbiEii/AbiGii toxin family protein [Bacteroidota bacterium]